MQKIILGFAFLVITTINTSFARSVTKENTYTAVSENVVADRKLAKRQRRLVKLQNRILKKCKCSDFSPSPEGREELEKPARMTVAGAFLMGLGVAALAVLFSITPTALIIPKILALISIIVGDSLICTHANVCILRTIGGVIDIFYWF